MGRNTQHQHFSSTTTNAILAGTGMLIGILGYENRDTLVGELALGVGANLIALGIAFGVRELVQA